MPTNDTEYSANLKVIGGKIMPLVINSLRGRHICVRVHTQHTHPPTPTSTHTNFADKSNFKKPGECWSPLYPKTFALYQYYTSSKMNA